MKEEPAPEAENSCHFIVFASHYKLLLHFIGIGAFFLV